MLHNFKEQIERSDVILLINACLAGTGQASFYARSEQQQASLGFLHEYMLGNYRALYALVLTLGINDFSRQEILFNLLSTRPPNRETQQQESPLIGKALQQLPVHRVYKLFGRLAQSRINHRRLRAVFKEYLVWRDNLIFDAVKYRRWLKVIFRHLHMGLPEEVGLFLFERQWKKRRFTTPLLESFRQAHYSGEAIYQLPYSVAEGLAARMKIPRKTFLKHIEPRLTPQEKLRLQQATQREGQRIELNPERVGLTALLLYILSLSPSERLDNMEQLQSWLTQCRQRFIPTWFKLERVALIVDNSYSASGSREQLRRPLGVALAVHFLLEAVACDYRVLWLSPPPHPLLAQAQGQTSLAEPLLEALAWGATDIMVVSDGYENAPTGGVAWLLQQVRKSQLLTHWPRLLHLNPIMNPEAFGPSSLSPDIPVIGIRDGEHLPLLWLLFQIHGQGLSLEQFMGYIQQSSHLLGGGIHGHTG